MTGVADVTATGDNPSCGLGSQLPCIPIPMAAATITNRTAKLALAAATEIDNFPPGSTGTGGAKSAGMSTRDAPQTFWLAGGVGMVIS